MSLLLAAMSDAPSAEGSAETPQDLTIFVQNLLDQMVSTVFLITVSDIHIIFSFVATAIQSDVHNNHRKK